MTGSNPFEDPIFGMTVTIGAYAAALLLHRKIRWLHPLLTAPLLIYGLLLAGKIDYSAYKLGGDIITFFLGPATVALAVPLYKHALRLRSKLPSLLMGALIGSVIGLGVNALSVALLGGSELMLKSALPKSVTASVAVDLSHWIGGSPELTAALTVLTGLFGSMLGPLLLRVCGVHERLAASVAIGAASHGIGSARLLAESEEDGGVSSFSMAACSVFTPMLLLPVHWFWL